MSGFQLVIVGIIILAALGFWNYQRAQGQKTALQQSGFEISERIGGSPELVIDVGRKEMALVHPDRVERFAFSELDRAEIGFDEHEDRSRYHYRIELSFSQQRQRRVQFGDQAQAETALKRFQSVVTHR
ncbi:hypothetical protein ACQUQP_18340 [Marinobacterium sp. YM272]|uniref:hypothetical protein n=1 Tax=Marinobacterium sp. YM272 TaxID=3421654 RepID=UPI003D7F92EE